MPIAISKAAFRSDLQARVGSPTYWVNTELDNAIQESLRMWNLLTGDWCGRIVIPTVAGAHWLMLPATLLVGMRVEYREKPVQQTSTFELDHGKPNWENESGAQVKFWAPVALNMIALSPAPATTDHALTIDGITQTPLLSSLGENDVIDLDPGHYETLLNYARHLLLLKLGGREFTESLAARKALWDDATSDNQRMQAASPYRRMEGAVLDNTQHPLYVGQKKAGVR